MRFRRAVTIKARARRDALQHGTCPPGRAEERDRFESLVTPHLVRF